MDVLKNRQFLKLWGNQILLQVAFNMCNFTALLLLNFLTHSRFVLAEFYAAMTLPAFGVGIFAGAIVDLSDRKKLMLITDLVLSGLFFCYALGSSSQWAVTVIALFAASAAQFFTPAEAATLPLIVKPYELRQANSLFLFTSLGSVMLGYLLAGPVIDTFGGVGLKGIRAAFILAGFLTLIGFFLRLSLRTLNNHRPEVAGVRIWHKTWVLTREAVGEAKHDARISIPIILLTAMEFNIGMLAIIFLDFVNQYLHRPTTAASYFLVLPLILGLGLGVGVMGQVDKILNRGEVIVISAVGFGLVLLGLGLTALLTHSPSITRSVTVGAAFLIGLAVVFVAVHSRTILQENTREEMLGRVFSLVTVASALISPVPVLLVSLLTEKVDVALLFILLGFFNTGVALMFNASLRRALSLAQVRDF